MYLALHFWDMTVIWLIGADILEEHYLQGKQDSTLISLHHKDFMPYI